MNLPSLIIFILLNHRFIMDIIDTLNVNQHFIHSYCFIIILLN